MTEGLRGTSESLHRLAAEFALSLLEEPELTMAESRYESDPVFRSSVNAWRGHFAGFVNDLSPRPASAAVWRNIEGQLGAPSAGPHESLTAKWWNHVGLWRTAALAGMSAAAAMLAVTVLPAGRERVSTLPPQRTAVASTLSAALLPKDGAALFVVTYDPLSQRIVVVPTGQPVPSTGRVLLWLVHGDEDPVALGAIEGARASQLTLSGDQAALLIVGTILVVTQEPADLGSKLPSSPGPLLAKGVMQQVRI